MQNDAPSKLCLGCARRALAKLPPKPCGTCPLVNADHLAIVRANYVKGLPAHVASSRITSRAVSER